MLFPGCWQGCAGRAGRVRDARGNPAICRASRRVQPRRGGTAGTGTHGGRPALPRLLPDGCERARHGWILIAFKPRCQLLCCWNVFRGRETEPGFKPSLFFQPIWGCSFGDWFGNRRAEMQPQRPPLKPCSPKHSPVHSGGRSDGVFLYWVKI